MKTPYILIKRGTTGFMTYIALDGYRRSIIKEGKLRETDRLIQDTLNKYELAVKQIKEKESLIVSDHTEVVASLGRIKQDIDLVNHDAHNLTNQISINNNQGIDTSAKVLNKSVNNLVNEINKLVDKINKRSGSSNNYLDNIYQFKDFFDSYTTTELGAIGHIFACFFIFGCLFDIAIAS
jgi:chromosome segregation ATPase